MTDLAKATSIDLSHLSRIESGQRNGTPRQLVAIAEALKVPLPAILSIGEVA